jgi:hypothetical protein
LPFADAFFNYVYCVRMTKQKGIRDIDVAQRLITRAILFVDRAGFAREVEKLLRIKMDLHALEHKQALDRPTKNVE